MMDNHQRGPPTSHSAHPLIDPLLTVSIEITGGLVEDNHLRILELGATQTQQLPFTAGQVFAVLHQSAVKSAQSFHHRQRSGMAQLLKQLRIVELCLRVEIITYRAGKQKRFLRHPSHLLTQCLLVEGGDVNVIEQNPATIRRIKTE